MNTQTELPLEVTKLRKWIVCPTCGTFIEMAGNYVETLSRHLVFEHKDLVADVQGIITRNVCYSHEPIGKRILGTSYQMAYVVDGHIIRDSGI